MPKQNRGGKRSAPQSALSFQQQAGTATQQQTQNILQDINSGSPVMYDNFMKLSDDAKADAIRAMMKQDVPDFLDDSASQKLLYYTNFEGLPEIVSDSALDKMPGQDLFRTVHAEYNRQQDVGYTQKQIYNQIAKGVYTRLSSSGGSAIGKGLYFADNYYHSAQAYGTGNPKKDLTMRAKLNKNARPISVGSVDRGISNEIAKGTKMGNLYKSLRSTWAGGSDARTIYALVNGYNVIKGGGANGYHAILDRKAMSLSSHTTDSTGMAWH